MSSFRFAVVPFVVLASISSIFAGPKSGVVIENRTNYKFMKTTIGSHHMSLWDNEFPASIDPGTNGEATVEFAHSGCAHDHHDHHDHDHHDHDHDHEYGFVEYQLEGTDLKFQVKSHHKDAEHEGPTLFAELKDFENISHQIVDLGWAEGDKVKFYLGGDHGNFEAKKD